MDIGREAEVLESQQGGRDESVAAVARRTALGRSVVGRYVERLENDLERLPTGPEASELYCARAELSECLYEDDAGRAGELYGRAHEAFGIGHDAYVGLRRMYRSSGAWDEVVALLESELDTAEGDRLRSLRLELARTYLYCMNDAPSAIGVLETLEAAPASDPEHDDGGRFDWEVFLLWEDALVASSDWPAYEKRLRGALGYQEDSGGMARYIVERLWVLYRYILKDDEQAQILWHHLETLGGLDGELARYGIIHALGEGDYEGLAGVLEGALEYDRESGAVGVWSDFYRSLLSDVRARRLGDGAGAAGLLDCAGGGASNDAAIFGQQVEISSELGRHGDLLNVMVGGLDQVSDPKLKAERLYDISCILRDRMGLEDSAVEVLVEANSHWPSYAPVVDALGRYYASRGMWDELARMYEYEISHARSQDPGGYTDEVMVFLHMRLARVYEYRLHYALNAFNHYQSVLSYVPDDIDALKGAGRMAQVGGNWSELLKLYAAAEGRTSDEREHMYLLGRISYIADTYLNDAETACTAMEALREINPDYSETLGRQARLYIKLGRWEDVVALNEGECARPCDGRYRASLLCRNAEISEVELGDTSRAISYYVRAREAAPDNMRAVLGLWRLYEGSGEWASLTALIRDAVSGVDSLVLKVGFLHRLAEVYRDCLGDEAGAAVVYEECLSADGGDGVAVNWLVDYYGREGRWEDALRVLDARIAASDLGDGVWPDYFRKGRVEWHRLDDPKRALSSFGTAFEMNPGNAVVFGTWLSLGLAVGDPEDMAAVMIRVLGQVSDDAVRGRISSALAELAVRETREPRTVADGDFAGHVAPYCTAGYLAGRDDARSMTLTAHACMAANGDWVGRLKLGFHLNAEDVLRHHAMLGAVVMGLPEELRGLTHDVLCGCADDALARHVWIMLGHVNRPGYEMLGDGVLAPVGTGVQSLRRWRAVCRLLGGDIDDPTDGLLPPDGAGVISYRADLELLASYFETFENWSGLLNVLDIQESDTLNEEEGVQISLQRAWVLRKVGRPGEALDAVRRTCEKCSFDNAMRDTLYDYFTQQKDWDFLITQIRRHLMNEKDAGRRTDLWLRMASVSRDGTGNMEEALRCLNSAYQEDPTRGGILRDIAAVARDLGEYGIARRALDDYIRYHKPSIDEQLSLEPQLLELHFSHPGGDTRRMIQYFERLAEETARSRQCLVILARAHAVAGDPQKAAEIILNIAAYPFEEEDVGLWLVLADLYINRLDEHEKGEELLWELFKTYPENEAVFGRIDGLYRGAAERRIMVEDIRKSVADSEVLRARPELAAHYLGFAGDVFRDLGAWRDAEKIYTEAIGMLPEPSSDLVRRRAYARCRVPGGARGAYDEFCALLVSDPFQPEIYRAVFDICRRNNATDRERVLRQLAGAFLPDERDLQPDDLRPKMMDSRQLGDDMLLRYLSHPNLRAVQVLLHEAMPLIGDVLRDQVPKRADLGGERLKSPEITRMMSMCASAFGVGSVTGYVSHDMSPVPTVLDEQSSYWVSTEAWEGMRMDMQRHWAGYVGGLLWTGVSRLNYFDPREVWRLLDGCYYLVTKRGIEGRNAYTVEASGRVNSAFKSGIRRDIARIIDEIGPENIPYSGAPQWRDGVEFTADRAGLLFSGNLTSSVAAVIWAEGWDASRTDMDYLRARYAQSRRLPELIAYALGDDYLELRFHAGLAMRPSTIGG